MHNFIWIQPFFSFSSLFFTLVCIFRSFFHNSLFLCALGFCILYQLFFCVCVASSSFIFHKLFFTKIIHKSWEWNERAQEKKNKNILYQSKVHENGVSFRKSDIAVKSFQKLNESIGWKGKYVCIRTNERINAEASFVLAATAASALALALSLCHTNLCICWTNTYLCRSFCWYPAIRFWHVCRRTTTTTTMKNPSHYKPHQMRCSYRPFSNLFSYLFHIVIIFFFLQTLSSKNYIHTLYLSCAMSVCLRTSPAPFFRHNFQPDISLIEFSLHFKPTNYHNNKNNNNAKKTTAWRWRWWRPRWIHIFTACMLRFVSVFAKKKWRTPRLCSCFQLFIHRLVWLNASMLIKIQKF